MTATPEQLKQTAAALVALADGRTIEFKCTWEKNGDWRTFEPTVMSEPDMSRYHYRVKPWQLPAPPAGKQWHRTDWTEEMLPVIDGKQTRPLLRDEIPVGGRGSGDEYKFDSRTDKFHWQSSYATQKAQEFSGFWRTTRPLPSEPVVRPWTFEDSPPEFKVRRRSDGKLAAAVSNTDNVSIWWRHDDDEQFSYAELAQDFTQLDGSPCGTTEAQP